MSDVEALVAQYEEWVACSDRCEDPRQHAFYASGGGFAWCWPKFNVYRPADTRPRVLLNRYPHVVIGVAVVIFGRCWGVRWKASKRRPPSGSSR